MLSSELKGINVCRCHWMFPGGHHRSRRGGLLVRGAAFSLSPEQDAKLFLADPESTAYNSSAHNDYYEKWKSHKGPCWTGEAFFPSTLSSDELAVARQEFKSIPECFYKESGFPVVTPAVAEWFLDHVSVPSCGIFLWCSSRLTYVATQLPFLACVLPN